MAWLYSGNPAYSEKDLVRFLVGDTDMKDPLLQDEEISFLLTSNSSPQQAAIAACRVLIAKYSREADYTIGPESVKASQRLTNFQRLKAELESSIKSKYAAPSWDASSIGKNSFDVGMHDFPRISAGPKLDG